MWIYWIILIFSNVYKASSYSDVLTGIANHTFHWNDNSILLNINSDAGTLHVVYGSEGVVTCDIRSSVPLRINWYHVEYGTGNIVRIVPSHKYSISTDGKRLIIKNMDLDLVGRYMCSAVYSQMVKVVLVAPKVKGKKYETAIRGTNIGIKCEIIKGSPKPNISWQFIVKSGLKSYPISDVGNVLYLRNVSERHAGRYKCLAENIAGQDEHITTLTVEFPPRIISNSSTVYKGLEGDMALKVPCKVAGIPQPVHTWKLNGNVIKPDRKYSIENGSLIIRKPTETDSATYTCETKNYLGSTNATFRTEIDKYIYDFGEKHYVYLLSGETRKLKCDGYFSTSQSVRWFIEEVEVNKGEPYLEVIKATMTDDGNYTCRVSNKHGDIQTHNYIVDVGYPPMLYVDTLIDDWRGDVNDILSNCDHDAKPLAQVEWKFNGKILVDRNITEVGVLYNWGNYKCTISNVHGSVEKSFDVKSSVCLVNKNLEQVQNLPLLLTKKLTWPVWDTSKHHSIIEQGEEIILSCADHKEKPNAFQKFPKLSYINAFCNKQDSFLVDGKLHKLSDFLCSDKIRPSVVKVKDNCLTEPSELLSVGYYAGYKGNFVETFKVCFDHGKSMPLYTRALMTKTDDLVGDTADDVWFLPGSENTKSIRRYNKCQSSNSTCCYSKSQLVNARDFNNAPAQRSTFTHYLNTFPSFRPCDSGYSEKQTTWEDINEVVRSQLLNYGDIVVFSGTHTFQQINETFVPRYVWKVLRFTDGETMAIVHVNDPSPTEKDIKCEDICATDYETWFKTTGQNTYCCTLTDFVQAFGLHSINFEE